MQCVTVRNGAECVFMTAKGCSFDGGRCLPVVEQCQGCARTQTRADGVFCNIAPNPAAKWNRGTCNLATHVERAKVEAAQKINPLKASKRAAARKS